MGGLHGMGLIVLVLYACVWDSSGNSVGGLLRMLCWLGKGIRCD